jgi:hypothetical protein
MVTNPQAGARLGGMSVAFSAPAFSLALAAMIAVSTSGKAAPPAYFGTPTNLSTAHGPVSIVVGDFSHDGRTDIAVIGFGGVSVLLNRGDGVMTLSSNYSAYGGDAAIAAGDFNGDGNLDLCVVPYSSQAGLLLGDGKGSFLVRSLQTSIGYSPGAAVGDLNKDGNLDLMVAYTGNPCVGVALGRGDGSFGTQAYYAVENNPGDIRGADIYRHGGLDLAVALCSYVGGSSNAFCVLSNKGDGTFAATRSYAGASINDQHYSLELADFNGDGSPDLAVLSYKTQSVTIWLNDGKGGFAPTNQYSLGFAPTSIAKGDFNTDGIMDLVIRGDGAARVLLGNGDGSFTLAPQMAAPADSGYCFGNSVAVADFNGDGAPDIAFVDYASNSVAIMLNQTPPVLQIAPMPGYSQIFWLATAGFTLKYTTNLTAGTWRPFPYPPVLFGTQKAVTDWTDGDQRFYRLRRQ